MPIFSVIIPTRDRDAYLGEAISSVVAQTTSDLEIILVNDGTRDVAHAVDPRIVTLDNRQRGPVAARNLGVASAHGKYIAFLDDDDRWIDPDFLAQSAALLRARAALAFGDGVMLFPSEVQPRQFARDADASSLSLDNTILISAVCYHRNLHDLLGGFDDTLPFYWDWDWYLRVARAGYVLARIAHPVVDIRIHPQNMSGEANAYSRTENLKLLAKKHGLGPLKLKNHATFAE